MISNCVPMCRSVNVNRLSAGWSPRQTRLTAASKTGTARKCLRSMGSTMNEQCDTSPTRKRGFSRLDTSPKYQPDAQARDLSLRYQPEAQARVALASAAGWKVEAPCGAYQR